VRTAAKVAICKEQKNVNQFPAFEIVAKAYISQPLFIRYV